MMPLDKVKWYDRIQVAMTNMSLLTMNTANYSNVWFDDVRVCDEWCVFLLGFRVSIFYNFRRKG